MSVKNKSLDLQIKYFNVAVLKLIFAYTLLISVLSLKVQSQPVPPPYEADTISRPFGWPEKGAVWYYKNTGYNKDIDYIRVTPYKKYIVPWFNPFMGDTLPSPGKSLKFEMFSADGKLIKDSIVIYQQTYTYYVKGKDTSYEFDSTIFFTDNLDDYYTYLDFNSLNYQFPQYLTKKMTFLPASKKYTIFTITDSFGYSINNIRYRAYRTKPNNLCMGQYDTVVWPIGSLKSFVPINECDYYEWGGPLLCYYDDNMNWFFKSDKSECPCFRETNKDLVTIIYPNPFSSYIHIKFAEIPANAQYEIYDNLGRVVRSIANINSLNITLDLSDLNEGIYYLKTITKEKIKCHKIVKQ